ncbi:MAG: phosphomannomutase [bacterium]
MSKILLKDFLKECGVKFGTSGVRAKVTELTDKVVFVYTLGFIKLLKTKFPDYDLKKIIIAGDLRPSTPHIKQIVRLAIESQGIECKDAGYVPIPALTYFGVRQNIPTIMITGSHIPSDRNGLKYIRQDGELMKEDEKIFFEGEVEFDESYLSNNKEVNPDTSSLQNEVLSEYKNMYISFFEPDFLKRKKIGVYGHSAVGRDILYDLINSFGAETFKLGYSDTFIPVDTEAIRPEDEELAKKWVEEYKLDAIVTTDGDSDRPMISDELGNWFKGDVLGIFVAKYLGIEALATPISSNTGIMGSGFKKVVSTKIGSPYVIESMRQLSKEFSKVGAYEANGGFLLGSKLTSNTGSLEPLETRDAMLPLLSILKFCIDQNMKLSELYSLIPARVTYSSKLDNFPLEKSKLIIEELGKDESKLKLQISNVVNSKISEVNTLDGIRLIFENGDIVHIRPSGNAPELRIYTESSSKDKSVEINENVRKILLSFK